MLITRREYKVMLDLAPLAQGAAAVEAFARDLAACASQTPDVSLGGKPFTEDDPRGICFLDTADHLLRQSGLILRQRTELAGKQRTEYTLKHRSPDRYIAAAAPVPARSGLKSAAKFEEDIGAPFVVRFSHSCTVKGPAQAPAQLKTAAKLFPALAKLESGGQPVAKNLPLHPVRGLAVHERVLKGPLLDFGKTEAEAALILWFDPAEQQLLAAEFSFHYADAKEAFSPKAARRALAFYTRLQSLGWCSPHAQTKTQFIYGSSS